MRPSLTDATQTPPGMGIVGTVTEARTTSDRLPARDAIKDSFLLALLPC
jgi:hypothetical protein